MYKELAILDSEKTEQEIRDIIFRSTEFGLSAYVLMPHFIPIMKECIPHGISLVCPIDYPNGIYDTSCRNHLVLSTIRKGANAIDLVLPFYFLLEHKYKKTVDDIESNKKICDDNNVTLRIMLDYRILDDDIIVKICEKLVAECKIEFFLPSTGYYLEDFEDNLLISQKISNKSKVNTIITCDIKTNKQWDVLQKTNLFGVRFKNLSTLERLFPLIKI